ncbi:unnamed protein product [Closterium sp. Naga37s-1]|nr:unnamed protein product [Closterium sp. Naga37s-1]
MHFSCPFLDVGTGWVLDVGTGWVLDVGTGWVLDVGTGWVLDVGTGWVLDVGTGWVLDVGTGWVLDVGTGWVLDVERREWNQVESGQATTEEGALSDSLYPLSSHLTPPRPQLFFPNMVNVARMFLEGLQVKEEDSDLLFPLSPLPTPSPPVSLLLPLVAAPSPSPTQNMVNVTRRFLEDLKLKEEDSIIVEMGIEGHEWAILQHWLSNPLRPSPPLFTRLAPSPSQNMVNVTRWFLEDLKLKEEDSVVVKMDIEGHEWAILQHWLSNPRMAAIVDELFVEVHYHHPTMTEFSWTAPQFNHTRHDATGLLTELRKAGFYVHP